VTGSFSGRRSVWKELETGQNYAVKYELCFSSHVVRRIQSGRYGLDLFGSELGLVHMAMRLEVYKMRDISLLVEKFGPEGLSFMDVVRYVLCYDNI
jgi:hypothetical protein